MAYAKLRTEGVILQPIPAGNAVPGELYRDQDNADVLTDQNTGGGDTPVGAASSDSVMTKLKQNKSGVTILAGTPVALLANGGIIKADSDGVTSQVLIAISIDEILNDEEGRVALIGPNIRNAIQGLGFTPGQPVYLNQDGSNRGFTTNLGDLTGNDDSIIKIGYADCAPGAASATADDLIVAHEVIALP